MSYCTCRQRRIVDEDGEDFEIHHFTLEDDAVIDLPWLRGIRFKHPPPQPIVLSLEDKDLEEGAFVDYLTTPIPLVSRRLKDAFERAGVSNVEYFDVVVEGAERFDDFPGYVAINIVGKVDVADKGKSQSTQTFGVPGANQFDTFVPRADLESELQVFRMAEHVSTIVVSDRIKVLSAELGVETLEFVPLAAWGG